MPNPDTRLEPLGRRHAAAVQRYAADPEVGATTLMPEPYPIDGAATFIESLHRHASGTGLAEGAELAFAILAREDRGRAEELVGVIGLKEISPHAGSAEIGYWIGRPFWGRGYATAAGREMIAFAFDSLGLDRLTAHILARNSASARVLEKLGFVRRSTVRNPFGKWDPEEPIAIWVLERDPR